MVNKNLSDKWYGWVALSYSQSERTNLRTRETNDYTFDTPVVLNVVGNYQFNDKWNGSFRITAKSGEATTKIIGFEANDDAPAGYYKEVYGEPFADRLPTYVRMDVRVERDFSFFGNEANFYVDVLNLLSGENVNERTLDYERVADSGELHIEDHSDEEVIPSIGMRVSF